MDGKLDGILVGISLGDSEGCTDGTSLGDSEGCTDGTLEGTSVGTSLGDSEGCTDGTSVGGSDGTSVGGSDGLELGWHKSDMRRCDRSEQEEYNCINCEFAGEVKPFNKGTHIYSQLTSMTSLIH